MKPDSTPATISNLAKQYNDPKPTVPLRLWLLLLGLIMMVVLALIIFIPSFILDVLRGFSIVQHSRLEDYLVEYLIVLILAVYLAKNVRNGQSFTKRTLRLQVLNNTSGEVASPLQTVIRNLTVLIWPVEIIMMMINPSRRIGDYIANTRLERYSVLSVPQKKYTLVQTLLAFFLSLVLCFTGTIPFQTLFAPYFT
jgi:uncharacterized RDD family membrane protein YckC